MTKLLVRSISGAIYVAIIVGCVIGGTFPTLLLASVFAVLGLVEYKKITASGSMVLGATTFMDIAGVLALVFSSVLPYSFYIWLGIYLLRCVEELYLKEENPIQNLSSSLFGQLFIGLPLMLMPIIADFGDCKGSGIANPLLAVFIFIWLSDTGAYLVGSAIGRHKLFERISPNKSWEGFWGGIIICVAASLLLCHYCAGFFAMPKNYVLWTLFALVVVIFGTWGDLLESLIKRTLGIKDSGNLIPGHGGILDRIDSLLLALPASAIFLLIADSFI